MKLLKVVQRVTKATYVAGYTMDLSPFLLNMDNKCLIFKHDDDSGYTTLSSIGIETFSNWDPLSIPYQLF